MTEQDNEETCGDYEESVDTLMAKELNSLSVTERNEVYESIHGVERPMEETEDFLAEKLNELEVAIGCIQHKPAYEQGMSTEAGEQFLSCRLFRLAFLRAERFDAKKAAVRLIFYLEEKLLRFGPRAVGRQLTLEDMSDYARSLLVKKGIIQILPARDRAGRAVLVTYYMEDNFRRELQNEPLCYGDALFYCMSAIVEDEETQKRGIISFSALSSTPKEKVLASFRESMSASPNAFATWCPVRVNGVHTWIRNSSPESLAAFAKYKISMGTSHRIRSRLHLGTFEECRNCLLTYGFPVNHLPFSLDGHIRLSAHVKWTQRRHNKESNQLLLDDPSFCFRVIDLPGIHDVCLGRGTAQHQHVGNIRMRSLMQPMTEDYQLASASKRQELNAAIIALIRNEGGKFLSRNDGGWLDVVTDEALIEKSVGGIFRSMVCRMNHKQEGQIFSSTLKGDNETPKAKIARMQMQQEIKDDLTWHSKELPTSSSH